LKVACVEEIAWRNNWINDAQLRTLSDKARQTDLGDYLLRLLDYKERE